MCIYITISSPRERLMHAVIFNLTGPERITSSCLPERLYIDAVINITASRVQTFCIIYSIDRH
jgi:hypothetical protein